MRAGDLLGAVTNAAAAVTNDATNTFMNLSQDPTNAAASQNFASGIIANLDEVALLIPQAQQQLVALASGAVNSVPLGIYQGQTATLDVNQLGLIDRIIAGGTNSAVGGTPLVGTGQVALIDGLVGGAILDGPVEVINRAKEVLDVLSTPMVGTMIPPGSVVTGLAIGSLSAVVAAAEAEALIVQGSFRLSNSISPSDLALIDQVLDDPALGQALNAITTGFVPTTPAGQALLEAALLAESLAAQIDPNVPGSGGSHFADYLNIVTLHQG